MRKIIITVFLALICTTGCNTRESTETASAGPVNARIGIYNGIPSLLVIIAKQNGYFNKYGIKAYIKPYPTGRDAVRAMFKGDEDFAVCADFVAVKDSFERSDFKIIASIAQSGLSTGVKDMASGIFAKKSSGIEKPADLKGKNVAVAVNTITEFLLGMFLEQNNMAFTDVHAVNIRMDQRTKFLENPKFDAYFVWPPKISKFYMAHLDKLVFFPSPDALPFHFLMTESDAFIKKNPEAARQILRALIDAENWAEQNPEKLKELTMKRFGLTKQNVEQSLKKRHLFVNLPYTLPKLMNIQGNWLKRYKPNNKKVNTDFSGLIDSAPLRSVKPDSVTIIE